MQRNRNKIILVLLVTMVLSSIAIYGVSYHINNKVKILVSDLATTLSSKIGHRVTMKSVSTHWQWFNLNIIIKDFEILDKQSGHPLCMINRVVSTVSTINSLLHFKIQFKNIVLDSPRLALNWDGVSLPDIVGLDGANLPSELDLTKVLHILASQQSVSIINGDFHVQGSNQADLPLMNLKLDFRQKSAFEYAILARGSIAAANPPEFVMAGNYLGNVENKSNYMFDFDIKTSNLHIDEFAKIFPQIQIDNKLTGRFFELGAHGAIQNDSLRFLNLDFIIDEILIGKELKLATGSGQVEYKPGKELVSFNIANLGIKNQAWYSKPLIIDELVSSFKFNSSAQELEIFSDDLQTKIMGIQAKSKFYARVLADNSIQYDIESNFQNAEVPKAKMLMPDGLISSGVNNWLQEAFVNGILQHANISNIDNKLKGRLELKNVELKFRPDWPSIHDIDAAIVFANEQIDIVTSKASILQSDVNFISAKISAIGNKPYHRVAIHGNIDSNLQNGLDYLRITPLKNAIADKLSPFQPAGNFNLDLKLDLNFDKPEMELITNGRITLQQDALKVQDVNLAIRDISGEVVFTNKTLNAKNLALKIFDQTAHADLKLHTEKTKSLQIKVSAPVQIESLKKIFPSFKFENISGGANFIAQLDLPWDDNEKYSILNITSNLQGIKVDLPAPLHKIAKAKLPMQIKYFISNDTATTVYLHLADWLDANLLVDDGKLVGGHIAFGSSKAMLATNEYLLVTGKLPYLDWDLWQDKLNSSTPIAALPLDVDILIDTLKFRDKKYDKMWVKYDSNAHKIVLDSPIIKGSIQLDPDTDKLEISLSSLNLGDTDLKNNNLIDTIISKHKAKTLPIVQFFCEDLHFNKRDYRKVSIQLLPRVYGYEIMELSASDDNILLQAQGQWQMDNNLYTQLSGTAYIKSFGKALYDWEYGTGVSKGEGEFNFALKWDGAPTQFTALKLHGTAHVELQSGVINGVNPGLGRIIGLLSLESIQRRLQLDFSDVMSKGLAFDTMQADIALKPGYLSSENILVNSPSARIELKGNANLKTHGLDFTMRVTPKVGVSIPVAAAIAIGSPAVGAAIWLIDKASGSKISEITSYKYQVTGTWDTPKITEIVDKS